MTVPATRKSLLLRIPRNVRCGYHYNREMAYTIPDWYLRLDAWEKSDNRNARTVIPNASVHDDLIRPIEATLAACKHHDALWSVVVPLLDRTQLLVDSFCSFHGQSAQYGRDLTATIAELARFKEWDFNEARLYRETWFANMIGPSEIRSHPLGATPYLEGMIRNHDWARDLALSFVLYRGGHESWLDVPHEPGEFMGALALNLLSGNGLPGNRQKLEQLDANWPMWMPHVRHWHRVQLELDPPSPHAALLWTRADAARMCATLQDKNLDGLALPSMEC